MTVVSAASATEIQQPLRSKMLQQNTNAPHKIYAQGKIYAQHNPYAGHSNSKGQQHPAAIVPRGRVAQCRLG
jgi:hypothetical protein